MNLGRSVGTFDSSNLLTSAWYTNRPQQCINLPHCHTNWSLQSPIKAWIHIVHKLFATQKLDVVGCKRVCSNTLCHFDDAFRKPKPYWYHQIPEKNQGKISQKLQECFFLSSISLIFSTSFVNQIWIRKKVDSKYLKSKRTSEVWENFFEENCSCVVISHSTSIVKMSYLQKN